MNPSNSGLQQWEKGFTPQVIKAKDWEPYRKLFTELYSTISLNEVRRIMATQYNFYARPKQCKTIIAKWGLGKNLKRITMLKVLRIQANRRLKRKSTIFLFKGQRVKKETLRRGRKKYRGIGKQPEWQELDSPVSIPSDIVYFTPKSSDSSDDSNPRSDQGAPSPIMYNSPPYPEGNTVDGTSLDLQDNSEEFFCFGSFTGNHPIISSPGLEKGQAAMSSPSAEKDQEPITKPSVPGVSMSSQLEHLIKPLDASASSTTSDVTTSEQKFPARAAYMESPSLRPEGPETWTLCFDCLVGGFTSHGTLSAESILFEALADKSPNQNNDYLSPNCTSSSCLAQFKINHPETHYFSTSLFIEQIRPVRV